MNAQILLLNKGYTCKYQFLDPKIISLIVKYRNPFGKLKETTLIHIENIIVVFVLSVLSLKGKKTSHIF